MKLQNENALRGFTKVRLVGQVKGHGFSRAEMTPSNSLFRAGFSPRGCVVRPTAAPFAALLLAVLAGCNVGPKYNPPQATAPQVYKESPDQFKETDGWKVAQPSDAMLR